VRRRTYGDDAHAFGNAEGSAAPAELVAGKAADRCNYQTEQRTVYVRGKKVCDLESG